MEPLASNTSSPQAESPNSLRSLNYNRSRVSSELLTLYAHTTGSEHPEISTELDRVILNEDSSKVMVRLTTQDLTPMLEYLEALGFELQAAAPEAHFVEGFLPIETIDAIAQAETGEIPGLLGVVAVARPEPLTTGIAISQADAVQESNRVRQALPDGVDGSGITIGVLSDSFDVSGNGSAAADIDTQDLPAQGVQVLQEGPIGGIDEGRAILQLIHDVAPGSELAFSSVFFGEADFAQQIRDLADPALGNADILIDDILYFDEPMFQDGIIAQAIDEVVQEQGVAYFASAGNSADQAYESDTFGASSDSDEIFFGTFHDFDPGEGVDTRQLITLAPGQVFIPTLQWDDPFYTLSGVETDLDIFLLDAETNAVLSGSANDNLLSQIPNERFSFTNTTGAPLQVEVVISLFEGPPPERLRYANYGDPVVFEEFGTNSGTIVPHAAAVGAQAVAAVNFFDQTEPADFTSVGPSTLLFTPDGDRLATPEIRQTPDIAAVQGIDTTFFGSPSLDGNPFPNFFGTSAAAPQAAAIAALILETEPDLSPEEIYQRLADSAIDVGPTGFDNQTGVGLINAFDAIFGPATPAPLPFFEDFEDGDLPLAFETQTTGAGQIRVTQEGDALGAGVVLLESSVDAFDASNELTLLLDLSALELTPSQSLNLSFDQREFDDEDDPLPEVFTGSIPGDGVSLSVDGVQWFRLVDLTGTQSQEVFQSFSVNLSEFAAKQSLDLGTEIQIRFQQTDNASAPLDGFAFDNIAVTVEGGIVEGPTDPRFGDPNSNQLQGSAGDDRLVGLGGQDILEGLAGNDVLEGGEGDDVLEGGEGNDILLGGTGQDRLSGGPGDDRLDGGSGDNTLLGGPGQDLFVLSLQGRQVIVDFDVNQDRLELAVGLSVGQLSIRQQGNQTQISTLDNNPLAFLLGVEADQITAASFVEP